MRMDRLGGKEGRKMNGGREGERGGSLVCITIRYTSQSVSQLVT